MKAASIDGAFGLLAACSIFNIEMLYCDVNTGQIKCLLDVAPARRGWPIYDDDDDDDAIRICKPYAGSAYRS